VTSWPADRERLNPARHSAAVRGPPPAAVWPAVWSITRGTRDVRPSGARGRERVFGGQDDARDLDEVLVAVARQLAQPPEGALFIQAGSLHEEALGPFDDLAVLQGLSLVRGLLAQGLELFEPLHGDRDRCLQIGLLRRLHQVGQDVVPLGALEEL